jgi:hypothetical protein
VTQVQRTRRARAPLLLLLLLLVAGSVAVSAASLLSAPPTPEVATRALAVSGDPRPGGILAVSGAGFAPGQHVNFSLNGAALLPPMAVEVGPNGTFSTELSLPSDLEAGRLAIGAVDATGSELAVAHVTALVGSASPSAPVPTEGQTAASPSADPEFLVARIPPSEWPDADAESAGSVTAVNPAPPSTTAPPPPAPAAPAPMAAMPGMEEHGGSLGCSGYAEPRVWVESQDWWSPIPELGGMGHMHMGMCFPAGQSVSGVVPFDVRVVLHHNAGTLVRIKMQDDNSTEHVVMRPNRAVGDGVYWYTLNIDTRNMPDGLRLFRFYADLEHPNGNTQTARPILPLRVENGTADKNWSDRDHELRATAWYKEASPELDWGYVGAVIENYSPGPHVGSATFDAKCFVNGEGGGEAQGAPQLASWSVHVDPDFHAGNEGLVVARGTGQLKSTISVATSGLSHGWHRLVVRCDQILGDREHSAVGVFSIMVDH